MNINDHTTPDKLEKYSFLWSEVRLAIASISLIIGGYPVVYRLMPSYSFFRPISGLLALAWIISGLASVYLAYRWNKNGQKLFGVKDQKDTWIFFITVISGINLGFAGLIGRNIGMSILPIKIVFLAVGVVYIYCAYYLHKRWKSYGEKIF